MDFTDLSLGDILEILNTEDRTNRINIRSVFVVPPDVEVPTDEDSVDEDDSSGNLGEQLLKVATEIRYPCVRKEKLEADSNRQWIDGELESPESPKVFENASYCEFENMTEVEVFELFFDENLYNMIIASSENYASFLKKPIPAISKDEIKVFIGILLLSGYNWVVGKCMYWDSGEDCHNKMVSSAMSEDRFTQIMQCLHISDSTQLDTADKLCKLRPMISALQEKCRKYFVPHEYLCFGETMVKYFDRHGNEHFIRRDPVEFGFKVSCLNTDFGYLIDFEIDQGNEKNIPLLSMLDNLPDEKRNMPFQIFVKKNFTSFDLFCILKAKGYNCTGSIKESRLPKDYPLPPKQEIITRGWENGNSCLKIEKNSGIAVTMWVGYYSVKTIASTSYGLMPQHQKSRSRIVDDHDTETIPEPYSVRQYDLHKGGMDRMVDDITTYRVHIRGRKWWWPLFSWMLDVAVNNAYHLHSKANGNVSLLDFRSKIAREYISKSIST